MKKFILIILLTASALYTAAAQQKNREVYPDQISIEHNEAVKRFSRDYVTAFPVSLSLTDLGELASTDNLLSIFNIEGDDNSTFLFQQGWDNASALNVSGDNNEIRLFQRGYDLLSVLNITGDANQFNLLQQGTDLQNHLNFKGTGIHIDLLQTEAGMKLIQTGPGAIPLTIRQGGGTIPLIIRNY